MNPSTSTRAAILLRALLDGPATAAALGRRLGMDKDNARKALDKLVCGGACVKGERHGREVAYSLTVYGERRARHAPEPTPQPVKVRRLPTVQGHLVEGYGRRRDDCARDEDCMEAWAVRESGPAHCPRFCSAFVAAAPMRATDFASGPGNGQAAIYAGERA